MKFTTITSSLLAIIPLATSSPLDTRTPLSARGVFTGYTTPTCAINNVPGVPITQFEATYTKIIHNACVDVIPNPTLSSLGFQSFNAGANPASPGGVQCKFDIFDQAGCAGSVKQTVFAGAGTETTCHDYDNGALTSLSVSGRSVRFYCPSVNP